MTNTAERMRKVVGVVAIGRNEGERLRQCLESVVGKVAAVVYVDSGSTDGSIALARSLDVEVVGLELATPFTAARARNEGIHRLKEIDPELEFVQVVDGDCEIIEGWMERALEVMDGEPSIAVACGRRRERSPDESVYNKLCDMEWNTPVGEAKACGGDALIRLDAFYAVGGYDPSLIAGEEPEMCYRLRAESWKIMGIDCDMTWHDARMMQFGQWWKRAVRSGHAYAEGRALHGDTADRFCVDQIRSIIEWAVLLPVLAFGLAWATWGASVLLLGAYGLLAHRVRRQRTAAGDAPADAALYAGFCVMGKFPQLLGAVRYWSNRVRGRRSTLIEYKHGARKTASDGRCNAVDVRMRILYVGGTLPSRSETFVYREVLALRDLGLDVNIASIHPRERGLGDERVEALADEAIEIYGPGPGRLLADATLEIAVHPARTLSVAGRGALDALLGTAALTRRPKVCWQCLAGLALARRVRRLGVEHIHAHMAHVPTTIAMYAARQLGIGFSFTGHAVDIFRERTLLEAKLQRASFTACISEWHRSFYHDLVLLDDDRLPIVRCGVDVDAFAPAERRAGEGALRVLAVGRLVKKKGFDVLIDAMTKLREAGSNVQCRIVGEGPERAALDTLVRARGVADRVSLMGVKSNDEVRCLMRDADLFVLPCRIDPTGDRDGIPVVLMEAMACGVCAISGDLPAIRELITDGKGGVLVEPGDVDALADALRELAADAGRRTRLGQAGRERVIEEFSLGVNVQRLIAAFSATVTGADPPGRNMYADAEGRAVEGDNEGKQAEIDRLLCGSNARR